MHVSEAKKLLADLQCEFGDADLKNTRLSSVYVVSKSIFGQTKVVKRSSLLGRFSRFISTRESEDSREKKVREYVAKALATLIHNSDLPKNLLEVFWRTRLYTELRNEDPLQNLESKHEVSANLEFLAFKDLHSAFTSDKAEQQLNEIRNFSLLDSKPKTAYTIATHEDFKKYLDIYGDISSLGLETYEKFLERQNTKSYPINEKLLLIRAAKQYRKTLKDKFLSSKTSSRTSDMALESKFMEKCVHKLKTGESWLFMGSCGQKEIHLDKVFSLLQALPETTKKSLGESVQKFLTVDKLPDPKVFVDEQIQRAFSEIDLLLGGIKFEGDLEFIKAVLPNSTRTVPEALKDILSEDQISRLEKTLQKGPLENTGVVLQELLANPDRNLPEVLAACLPNQLKNKLEGGLKAGFLENLIYLSRQMPPREMTEFLSLIVQVLDLSNVSHVNALAGLLQLIRLVPSENGAKVLKLLLENLQLVSTADGRSALRAKIEDVIKSKSSSIAGGLEHALNSTLASFFETIRSKISPEMMIFLDPEGYLSYSEFWVECKKEEKDYTVFIYPSKALLKKHPVCENEVQWPLKMSGVPQKKLNSEFFYKLLYQSIEPQCNPNCVVRGEDFYQGICDYLGRRIEVDESLWRHQNEEFGTEMALAKLMLTPPHLSASCSSIQVHFDLLNDLCVPHRHGKVLEIHDEALCTTLENSIKWVMRDVEKQKSLLSTDLYRRYKATESEISQAIHAFKLAKAAITPKSHEANGLNLSAPLFKQLQNIFHKAGIDDSYIRFCKPTLAWAFGEEVDNFIDTLADSVGPITKTNATKQWIVPEKNVGEKGWLRQLVSSFYFFAAVIALKTVLTAAQLYRGTMPPFVAISSAHFVGKYLLPESLQVWLTEVFGQVLQKFIQGASYLVLRCIMNPEQITQMRIFAGSWKRTMKHLAENALGKAKISFELNPSVKQTNSNSVEAHLGKEQSLDVKVKRNDAVVARGLDLANLTAPSAKNLLNTLMTWKKDLSGFKGDMFFFLYITKQFNTLPVPRNGFDPFWDTVDYPDKCLQALSDLAADFMDTFMDERGADRVGYIVVSSYALFSMIDKLRRRIPELQLENYDLDYSDFVIWIQNRNSRISDPFIVERLKQILSFYGLSFDLLPSVAEMQKRRNSLLFSTPAIENIEFACPIEEKYLKERAQDPQITTKLLEASFTLESFKALKNSSKEEKEAVITVLVQNRALGKLTRTHIQEITKKSIPKDASEVLLPEEFAECCEHILQALDDPQWQYKYPALNHLLASFFVTEKTSTAEKVKILRYDAKMGSDRYLFKDERSSCILPKAFVCLKGHVMRCKKFLKHELNQECKSFKVGSIYSHIGSNKLWYLKEVVSENFFDYLPDLSFQKPHEFISQKILNDRVGGIFFERTESILTAIDFYRNHMHLLGQSEYLSELWKIIFECGQLSNQIAKQPLLAKYATLFFRDLIEYHQEHSEPIVTLGLLYFGRKALLLMQSQVKEDLFSLMQIPIFLEKIKERLVKSTQGKLLYHAFLALTLEKLDKKCFVSLLIYRFYQRASSPSSRDFNFLDLMLLESEEKFWESLMSLREYFSHPKQAQECIQELVEALDVFPREITIQWKAVQGKELLFTSGYYEIDILEALLIECASKKDVIRLKELENVKIAQMRLSKNSVPLILIDSSRVPEGLRSLVRFCPFSSIKFYASESKNFVEQISFTPFNLTFEIKKQNGQDLAFNEELFADFYIAPKQFCPQLNAFGNYLLLENHDGERKVLIPHEQWKSGLLMRFLEGAGPWATTLVALMDHWNVGEKSSYSVFEMKNDGGLVSENPSDVALIIALYLLQGNKKLAKASCEYFERLCKQVNLPNVTYISVLPLLISPIDVDGVILIRQRMLAALEENQSTQTLSRMPLDGNIHLWIATVIMLDMTTQKEILLTEFQEWFLFKSFFYHAIKAAQLVKKSNDAPWSFLVGNLQTALDSLILPVNLRTRFEFLEKKLGKERSLFTRGVKFASKVASTSSLIPTLSREIFNTSAHQQEDSLPKELLTLVIRSALTVSFDIRSLKLSSLIEEFRVDDKKVSFKISELSPSQFKKGYFTYYQIAKTGKKHPEWENLGQMLLLLKGGWDKQTQILVEYLLAIQKMPLLFPSVESFKEVIFLRKDVSGVDLVNFQYRYPELIAFFESMNNKVIGLNTASTALGQIVKFIERKVIGDVMVAQLPVFANVPFPLIVFPLMRLGSSTGRVLWNEWNQISPAETSKKRDGDLSYYSHLNQEDDFFDRELKEIYDLAFRTDENTIIPNSESSIWTAYCSLSAKQVLYQKHLEEEKKQLISLFTKNALKDPDEVFHQLEKCFLKGDFTEMLKDLTIEPEVLRTLELSFASHLVRWTRVQQISRASRLLEQLAQDQINTVSQQKNTIQKFAEELRSKRAYRFDQLSLRLLRRLLLFEFNSNSLIQNHSLKGILQEKNAIESLLATSENYTVLPALNTIEANGEQIVINIFSTHRFETGFRKLNQQAQIFHQTPNVWRFGRKASFTIENLDAIQTVLQRALCAGETMNMTKEDAQSLELIFIEKLNEYALTKKTDDEFVLIKLAQILQVVRTKCKPRGVDSHEFFKYREQLKYPFGPSLVIQTSDYLLIEACMAASADILMSHRCKKISQSEYEDAVAKPVAILMTKHALFKNLNQTQLKDLEIFFSTREKATPSWIKEHALYRQMCVVRGVLAELLFSVINSRPNQDEYSNKTENFSNNIPHEDMVKIFDQFLQKGLTDKQLDQVLKHIQQKIHREAKSQNIPFFKTRGYSLVVDVFSADLFDAIPPEKIPIEQFEHLKNHPKMIILYIRHFVRENIRYWKESTSSNEYDFNEMFASGIDRSVFQVENKMLPNELLEDYTKKILAKDRRVCLDKILQAKTIQEMSSYFNEFRSFFIKKIEDDPCILFGPLKIQRKAALVCKSILSQTFTLLENSPYFTQSEKEAHKLVRENVQPGKIPEKVHAYLDGGRIQHGVMGDLNQISQIEIGLAEHQNANHLSLAQPSWTDTFDPHSANLLNFASLQGNEPLQGKFSHWMNKSNPRLFAARELFELSKNETFSDVSHHFDRRIWFSNSLLPEKLKDIQETSIEFFTTLQKEHLNILVQVEEDVSGINVVSAGFISLKDTASLRSLFAKYKAKTSSKSFVYDIQAELPIFGAQVNLTLLMKSTSFITLISQLKFLSGATLYKPEELSYLDDWFEKAGRDRMHSIFEQIYYTRNRTDLVGSNIDYLFKKHYSAFEQL